MQSPTTLTITSPGTVIEAAPLTREAFAPFGDVIENQRPDVHPSSASAHPCLPFDGISANQSSAIKYQHVSRNINLYDQAPSGQPGQPVMNMFVCAARARIPPPPQTDPAPTRPRPRPPPPTPLRAPPLLLPSTFPVSVLERHPYTTQTFIPLTPPHHTPATQQHHTYLVIVAPTLPAPGPDSTLPVPTRIPSPSTHYPRPLPGPGLPDLARLRAFVATRAQAVTYAAGTWHAPMVALGAAGTAVDFVVVQFANGVAGEDCQEVVLASSGAG
ncbi:ureidoglycolate hydrolase, partial [Trichocladium antarcticum]